MWVPLKCEQNTWGHILEDSCLSPNQSSLSMVRISCPPPLSMVGFCLAWDSAGLETPFACSLFLSTLSFSSSAMTRGPLQEKVCYRCPSSGRNLLQFLILCTLTRSLPSLRGESFLSLTGFTAGQDWWLLFFSDSLCSTFQPNES